MRHRFSTSALIAFLAVGVPTVLGQQKSRLNGHRVALDAHGKLLSWVKPQEQAYDRVVKMAWDFICDRLPVESNGLRTYLTHSTFDPATLHGTDWPHNPAGLYAMFVDSALAYYAYSGAHVVADRVREMLDYQLAHGTTLAGWDWANVPYASSDAGRSSTLARTTSTIVEKKAALPLAGSATGTTRSSPTKSASLG